MLTFGPRESINPNGDRPSSDPHIPINVVNPQFNSETPSHFNTNVVGTGIYADNVSQSGYIAEEHTPTGTNPENEVDSEYQNFARLEKQIKQSNMAVGAAYTDTDLRTVEPLAGSQGASRLAAELNSSRDTQ